MAARKTPSAGGKPDKMMRDAIMFALNREVTTTVGGKKVKTKQLSRIADKLVELAADGDVIAIKEINDRVDGKATQPLAGDRDNPLFDLTGIREALAEKFARAASEG